MERYNTGKIEIQLNGCECFVPSDLPLNNPSLNYSPEIVKLLSEADRAISYMDGIVEMVPDLNLLSFMFARKEALLSAQIEGTEATFCGLLSYEANIESSDDPEHIQQVRNNFQALTEGVKTIEKDPISIYQICNLHKILLKGVRGRDKLPGIIRPIQNFVGGDDCFSATYTPPPQEYVRFRLDNLIEYIQDGEGEPPLIKAAIIYAYFEMIHPFIDGNGRIGRLLIILFLFSKNVLQHRFLTISYYLKENRKEHYYRLNQVSKKGDIEGWILFFLKAVIEASNLTTDTARSIKSLKDQLDEWVMNKNIGGIHGIQLNQLLFSSPFVSIDTVKKHCNISHQAASKLVQKYVNAGYLIERTGKMRYRQYMYSDFVNVLSKGTNLPKNNE